MHPWPAQHAWPAPPQALHLLVSAQVVTPALQSVPTVTQIRLLLQQLPPPQLLLGQLQGPPSAPQVAHMPLTQPTPMAVQLLLAQHCWPMPPQAAQALFWQIMAAPQSWPLVTHFMEVALQQPALHMLLPQQG